MKKLSALLVSMLALLLSLPATAGKKMKLVSKPQTAGMLKLTEQSFIMKIKTAGHLMNIDNRGEFNSDYLVHR